MEVHPFTHSLYKNMLPGQSHPLYTVAQIRQIEQQAISAGIHANTLMQRAGQAAYRQLRHHWPKARRIAVYCGEGNNGGDGYVVAQLAHQDGLAVRVYYLGQLERLPASAQQAMQACVAAGISPQPFTSAEIHSADIIVDALLGIGLNRPVSADCAQAIHVINHAAAPVLALDIPSGIDANTGQVCGQAVQATITVTLLAHKRGLFTGAAPAYRGILILENLAVAAQDISPAAHTLAFHAGQLPPRRLDAHKGDFGHVLVIGGNHGMGGAVRLAAEAAARTGAGLVSVATRPAHVPAIIAARPEIMCHGIGQADELAPLLARATVILLGAGLGQDAWAQQLYSAALASPLPKVIDADALNLLSQQPVALPNAILTPHPGEAARLLGGDTDIQRDRFTAALQLQQRYGSIIVLKGAGTIIQSQTTAVCTAGNPGMASGGMGDVLGGIIAGLWAQGLPAPGAAGLGVLAHAVAADQAACAGTRGLLALDLLAQLRGLLNPESLSERVLCELENSTIF